MNKNEIVTQISEKRRLSIPDATSIVEAMFDIIKGTLEQGEKVKIANFGSFSVRAKNQRRGRHPKTGAELNIAGKKVVKFKASDEMKKRVKSGSASV